MSEKTVPELRDGFPDHIANMDISKLQYVADMLIELRKLSNDLDESTLTYLIEMALLEAKQRLQLIQFDGELAD